MCCRWADKPDQAIVLLHRRPFDSSAVHDILTKQTPTSVHFANDVYAKVYDAELTLIASCMTGSKLPVHYTV